MADYNFPPDNMSPIVLHAGDRLDVNDHGTSHDITILDDAQEVVGKGGISVRTTINEGGREVVFGGTANLTTVNNGQFDLFDHATADHTKLNGYSSSPGRITCPMVKTLRLCTVPSTGAVTSTRRSMSLVTAIFSRRSPIF